MEGNIRGYIKYIYAYIQVYKRSALYVSVRLYIHELVPLFLKCRSEILPTSSFVGTAAIGLYKLID